MSPRLRIWLAALVLAVPPLAIALTWAALAPQLCRCGAHPRILRALEALAEGGAVSGTRQRA